MNAERYVLRYQRYFSEKHPQNLLRDLRPQGSRALSLPTFHSLALGRLLLRFEPLTQHKTLNMRSGGKKSQTPGCGGYLGVISSTVVRAGFSSLSWGFVESPSGARAVKVKEAGSSGSRYFMADSRA
jgi:hypothetical protein